MVFEEWDLLLREVSVVIFETWATLVYYEWVVMENSLNSLWSFFLIFILFSLDLQFTIFHLTTLFAMIFNVLVIH